VENLGGRMRRMKKRGPNVLFDLNDLLFFLTLMQLWFLNIYSKLHHWKLRKLCHTVPNFLNFTSSLLMLLFVQPLSRNSVINCQALNLYIHTDFWSKFCLLYWMAPCWQAVWRVIFKICVIFGVLFERRKVDKKRKPTRKLKDTNFILGYFEYFCQMLW